MAKYLTNLDLNLNELQNAVIQNLASAPANPKVGQVYYNTTSNKFCIYEGDKWSSYPTLTDMADALALKADTSYVNEELAKKADKETTYTKTEVDGLVSPKADKTYVDEQLELKADKSTTYTKEEVDGLVSPKADKTYVDEQLAKKVDAETYATDKKALEDAIALKADKTYVDEELAKKVDAETYATDKAALEKADQDNASATEKVAEDLAKYIESNDTALSLKANSADVYAKTETYNREEIDQKIAEKDSLPAQENNAGKFLTTDGSVASWKTIQSSDDEFTTGTSTTLVPTVKQTVDALTLKANDSEVVHTTGDEEIAGVKTFTADTIYLPADKLTVVDTSKGNYIGRLTSVTEGGTGASLIQVINNGGVSSSMMVGDESGKMGAVTSSVNGEVVKSAVQVSDGESSSAIELTLNTDNSVSTKLTGAAATIPADSNDGQIATTAFVNSHVSSAIANKADKSTTLAGYGIENAYTKDEVDAKVSSVYRFKGSVASESALPTEGNVIGDVYNVEDTGSNYAWDGSAWDKLSETVDLTPYLTKADAQATYETIANVDALEKALEDAIALKADKTYVDDELAKKANSTDVETTYLKKADAETTYATKEELGQLTDSSVFKVAVTNEELVPSDGVATWNVSHSLGEDVTVIMKEVATNEVVYADYVLANNMVTIKMNAAETIAANTYKVTILG